MLAGAPWALRKAAAEGMASPGSYTFTIPSWSPSMPYPPVCSDAGWTGAPPQVFPARPPTPNCIGPAAPAAFSPECTPGASERP